MKSGWSCIDCGVSTRQLGEYYMVHDRVWQAVGNPKGMLCLTCLEGRLGQPLKSQDFTDCPLNLDPREQRSEKLTQLLKGVTLTPAAWAARPRTKKRSKA